MKGIFYFLTSILLTCGAYCTVASPITVSGNLGFTSGQLPIDPTTGQMVQSDIATLTTLTLSNLKTVLKTKGFKLKSVLNTVVYLTDIRDYEAMLQAYSAVFNMPNPPSMEVIEASNLPLRARIQISCIADSNR